MNKIIGVLYCGVIAALYVFTGFVVYNLYSKASKKPSIVEVEARNCAVYVCQDAGVDVFAYGLGEVFYRDGGSRVINICTCQSGPTKLRREFLEGMGDEPPGDFSL